MRLGRSARLQQSGSGPAGVAVTTSLFRFDLRGETAGNARADPVARLVRYNLQPLSSCGLSVTPARLGPALGNLIGEVVNAGCLWPNEAVRELHSGPEQRALAGGSLNCLNEPAILENLDGIDACQQSYLKA